MDSFDSGWRAVDRCPRSLGKYCRRRERSAAEHGVFRNECQKQDCESRRPRWRGQNLPKLSQCRRVGRQRRFIITAHAGIHLRSFLQGHLDSGLRRNDEWKSRLIVYNFRTSRLKAEAHSVDNFGCRLNEMPATLPAQKVSTFRSAVRGSDK